MSDYYYDPRPYHQVARAAATERLRMRIASAFVDMLRSKWLDEITLNAVAAAAQTTRQTLIHHFGGKDGLVAAAITMAGHEILERRPLSDGASPASVAETLIADYEMSGDMLIRLLAQEARHPELTPFLNTRSAGHRAWLEAAFATTLASLPERPRDALPDELVAVTDVYVWKLFRRDLGHGAAEVSQLMTRLLHKVVSER